MKKSAIQSTRRRRLAIIDSLLDPDSSTNPELTLGDSVTLRWADPDIDDWCALPDGRDSESVGIVIGIDDSIMPAQVTVLWSTGEIIWDYADDLTKIESITHAGGP